MFDTATFSGAPLDAAYAETRMRNEPIVEVTQVKGDSETHPALSPNDEWANFEIMPFRIGDWTPSKADGSYVRQAYLRGLELSKQGKGNPYRFGLIGASDTHVAAGAYYWSKVGLVDDASFARFSAAKNPARRRRQTIISRPGALPASAVWADSNTREGIFDAMRRKENLCNNGPAFQTVFCEAF